MSEEKNIAPKDTPWNDPHPQWTPPELNPFWGSFWVLFVIGFLMFFFWGYLAVSLARLNSGILIVFWSGPLIAFTSLFRKKWRGIGIGFLVALGICLLGVVVVCGPMLFR